MARRAPRPDIWLFPFLNAYPIRGVSKASADVGYSLWLSDSSGADRPVVSLSIQAPAGHVELHGGGQLQLNKSWMARLEFGFLTSRKQIIAGLEYRFPL